MGATLRDVDLVDELRTIQDSGIRFTVELVGDSKFMVRLGNYREIPLAVATIDGFDEAVFWLATQVKIITSQSTG